MLQCLICLAEEERDSRYSIKELFSDVSDDIFIGIIGGELKSSALKCGGRRSRVVARSIKDRRIYYRAYAFAARFIAGLDELPNEEQRDTRALMWRKPLRGLLSNDGCRATAKEIYDKAIELANAIPDLAKYAIDIKQEEVLVDLPFNRVVVRGGDILTRTDGGHIGTPQSVFRSRTVVTGIRAPETMRLRIHAAQSSGPSGVGIAGSCSLKPSISSWTSRPPAQQK